MKKYIQPAMAIYNLNSKAVLALTSFGLYNEEVDGSNALGKKNNNDDWDEDEDF